MHDYFQSTVEWIHFSDATEAHGMRLELFSYVPSDFGFLGTTTEPLVKKPIQETLFKK